MREHEYEDGKLSSSSGDEPSSQISSNSSDSIAVVEIPKIRPANPSRLYLNPTPSEFVVRSYWNIPEISILPCFALRLSVVCQRGWLHAFVCRADIFGIIISEIKTLSARRSNFTGPIPIRPRIPGTAMNTTSDACERDRDFHESLLDGNDNNDTSQSKSHASGVHEEEIKTAPLFSAEILRRVTPMHPSNSKSSNLTILSQYGLLAKVLETFDDSGVVKSPEDMDEQHQQNGIFRFDTGLNAQSDDKRLFINMNAPWSAFICGSQGSGKSHTLSCMLEGGLMKSKLGPLPEPLAAMVFHYDKFTGFENTQVCEAAYLASSGIPVKVMVSPTSYHRMRHAYENLPGFPSKAEKPLVVPLFLDEKQLNIERMLKLMAIEDDGRTALYMEVSATISRSKLSQNVEIGRCY